MSANPQKRPDNQHVDLITRFREEYAKALDEARVSVDHTNTEGWRRLYVNERSEESQIIRQLSKDIAAAAQTIQLVGPTEDGDKELGDIKKRCTAIRERREAFDRNTVAPVKEPVEQCGRVIERFRSSARVQEQGCAAAQRRA